MEYYVLASTTSHVFSDCYDESARIYQIVDEYERKKGKINVTQRSREEQTVQYLVTLCCDTPSYLFSFLCPAWRHGDFFLSSWVWAWFPFFVTAINITTVVIRGDPTITIPVPIVVVSSLNLWSIIFVSS